MPSLICHSSSRRLSMCVLINLYLNPPQLCPDMALRPVSGTHPLLLTITQDSIRPKQLHCGAPNQEGVDAPLASKKRGAHSTGCVSPLQYLDYSQDSSRKSQACKKGRGRGHASACRLGRVDC